MKLRHVLLVEDNADDEALTIRTLGRSNVANEVRVARDGAEALRDIFGAGDSNAETPALILLDLNLPKIDGLEVLRRIRSDPRTATGASRDPDILQGAGGHSRWLRLWRKCLCAQAGEIGGFLLTP